MDKRMAGLAKTACQKGISRRMLTQSLFNELDVFFWDDGRMGVLGTTAFHTDDLLFWLCRCLG
jgi:hypothetical protein